MKPRRLRYRRRNSRLHEQAMNPSSNYARVLDTELHYMEWGAGNAGTVIAWHGLARTGRDMDDIAAHLARRWRVICPDTIGRGLSQWSRAPEREYCFAHYEKLAVALLDRLGLDRVHWLGTSMGGALGLRAAAGALRGRMARLVLNDIGPEVAPSAIERIRTYAGSPPAFDTVGELEAYFRTVYKPYGAITDAQWRRLTESSTRRLPDGRVTPHYDPAMVQQFIHHPRDYDQWEAWNRLDIPVLALRGVDSDLLLPEVARRMAETGPRATVITVPGCGHAPALNTPEHFAWVEDFLAGR
jgi:pimeloyl-ACP methyl ester carboxylesterase